MFFKRKKIKQQKIKENKQKMRELFASNIEKSDNYNLVYGYNREFSKDVADYIYTSLIIGYDNDNWHLIILETDKDFLNVKNIIKLKKSDFSKATYNKNLEEYVIYLNRKKQDNIKFSLINENYIDIDILAFIEQEIEVEDFKDFYQEFKRKPRIKSKKNKIVKKNKKEK